MSPINPREDYVAVFAARREARKSLPDCRCGHPATHHDAGECWTNPDGTESEDEVCPCGWYEAEIS